jgi:lysophospholipase L1-like esterase
VVTPTVTSPPRRTLSTGRKVLFSAVLLLVMLVALEAAVRVRAWIRYGSAESGMTDAMLVPNPVTGLRAPQPGFVQESGKISIRINSLGFRGPDISPTKPRRTVRIATVGASTTFCGEVSSNDATWPAQLQALLQKAHPDVKIEVINAGVPGYVITESLKNLELRVLPLNPDLVIYYEVNNDMALDSRALALQQGLVPAKSGLGTALARASLLYDLVQKNVRIWLARRGTEAKLGPLPADLPKRYLDQVDAMRQLLSDRQIPLVLSTFFVKFRRAQPRETQIENASVVFFYMPWMTIDGLLDGFDMYNNALVGYAGTHHVPVIDDRDSIPGDSAHFADWAHFTDQGAAAMGRRFAGFIEQNKLLQAAIDRAARGE